LNHEKLSSGAKSLLEEIKLELPITNPYKALIARAIELVEAYELAIEIIQSYAPKGPNRVELELKSGEGCAATEAPRGLLYHQYQIDGQGFIQGARIIPPTAQNLARIEADLRVRVPQIIDKLQNEATLDCEHLIRAYDPCISCATHFLTLTVESK